MLLLASTSDKIQVITSAAGQVDVHASWVDLSGTTITAGRTNTRIATATTTDVVAAPASSTTRNVKQLKVGNNSASVTNTVTIQHTDGTNVIVIEQVTLAPLERIGYEEGTGVRVFDSAGREKIINGGLPTGNANTSDVVANAAATYLTGSGLQIGSRVQAASFFKWRLRVTKTGAGIATPTVAVYVGPNGTIRLDHTSADGAGLGTFRYLSANSASFALGANDYIGLVVNPGASGVWTFQHVIIDAGNLTG
jgi:hypothetical protein